MGALGVELVEGLDGQKLIGALVLHHRVHVAAHHQRVRLPQRPAAVLVRHRCWLAALCGDGVRLPTLEWLLLARQHLREKVEYIY